MHDKARDDDGEAITDCVAGRKGATLKPVDDPTPSGWSALHVAGVYNTASAAAAAISNSGDVLAQDVHGRTPLHLAAANNAVETLSHMVAKVGRGNLDKVRDAEGNTPYHMYIYVHVHICVYIHIYTYMYMYMYTYICTYIYIYTHTHTHTHTYI